MKRIISLTILLALITLTSVNAQNNRHQERWEKYRAEKIAFLTSKLELTPNEAQKFWPVYNQLDKERWQAQKLRNDLERQVREAETTLSEKEITELTREYAGSLQQEADVLVKYNEKFLKILPPRKVLELYKAENEFRMYMIKKYRDRHKEGD